jgi:hypothetical protein
MDGVGEQEVIMTTRSNTRGVCFDPTTAKAERALRREELLAESRKVHTTTMREHGRMLDQIETCYRQHKPQQQVVLEAMQRDAERDCLSAVREGAQ